jgi:signal transduction histidine kinase/DNA-binding NarL/FixJ family response regulator
LLLLQLIPKAKTEPKSLFAVMTEPPELSNTSISKTPVPFTLPKLKNFNSLLEKLSSSFYLSRLMVGRKIRMGYCISLSVATAGTLMGLLVGNYYQDQIRKASKEAFEETRITHNLQTILLIIQTHQRQLALLEDPKEIQTEYYELRCYRPQFDQAWGEFEALVQGFGTEPQALYQFDQDGSDENDVFLVELLANSKDLPEQYFDTLNGLLQRVAWDDLESPEVKNLIRRQLLDFNRSEVSSELDRMIQDLGHVLEKTNVERDEKIERLQWIDNFNTILVLASTGLSLLVAALIASLTTLAITHPLKIATESAQKIIEEGNFEKKIPVITQDEIGILTTSFNNLVNRVQTLLDAQIERTIELQEARDQAETASQSKTQFLANMNHELRTPLNGILGYTQILQRDSEITPKQLQQVEVIHRCGSHLLTLISDLLDIAKIESGKMQLYPQEIHLANFLSTTAEICRIRSQQKNIEFHPNFSADLPLAIYADEKRLRQVLLNLLSNAIKFTDRGRMTFQVSVIHPSCLRFQVEDTGIGIKAEQISAIFEPFQQAGSQDFNSQGTGLGLTISQQIVQLMGSTIQVESILGTGSRFWFDLEVPWIKEQTNQVTQTAAAQVIGYKGNRRTLLVVDDNPDSRAILTQMLEPLGFHILQATNGQEGLEQAILHRPGLIILDIVMPVMTGLEMAQRLRQLPETSHIPLLACSASLSQVEPQTTLDAGCNSFTAKPIEMTVLLDQLRQYLGLEWIYKPQAPPASAEAADSQPGATIVPTWEELQALNQAVAKGFIGEVRQEADRLKTLNPAYGAFANKILELAQEFDMEAIQTLIHSLVNHLDRSSTEG